jgi:hypothetical protein
MGAESALYRRAAGNGAGRQVRRRPRSTPWPRRSLSPARRAMSGPSPTGPADGRASEPAGRSPAGRTRHRPARPARLPGPAPPSLRRRASGPDHGRATARQGIMEPLTRRELEVLGMLAAGKSNQAPHASWWSPLTLSRSTSATSWASSARPTGPRPSPGPASWASSPSAAPSANPALPGGRVPGDRSVREPSRRWRAGAMAHWAPRRPVNPGRCATPWRMPDQKRCKSGWLLCHQGTTTFPMMLVPLTVPQ